MGVMCKAIVQLENIDDNSNTQKQNKNGASERDKSNEKIFAQTKKHEKVLLL